MTNTYNIKNSKHLTQLLSKISINKDTKIISLDIKEMYSNIPVSESLQIIENHLHILNSSQSETKQLIELLGLKML